MSSSTLADFAIDLINDAKGSVDISKKIYYLEQVKEIILFREPSLLIEVFPSILDFMVEKSSDVKKFLLSLCSDVLQRSFSSLHLVLNLYSHILASDNADSVVKKVCVDMKQFYEKMIMYVAQLPPMKPKTILSSTVVDPKQLWGSLRALTSAIIDIASSTKRESVKILALKFIESIILFGISSPTEVVPAKPLDPRLQRAAASAAASTAASASSTTVELTANAIPLHHPFISRDELELEAEALLSKLLLWASKGGPQGRPFTPELMSLLGQSLASITTARPRVLSKATVAIVFLMQGKGNMCHLMTGSAREVLARSVHRLIRSLTGRKDEDGSISKLRTAVEAIEKLGFDSNGTIAVGDDITGDRKRNRDAISEGDDDNADGIDEQQRKHIRDRAIADLNSTDTLISKPSALGQVSGPGGVGAGAASAADGSLAVTGASASATGASSSSNIVASVSPDTELLTMLADIKSSFSAGMTFVSVSSVPIAPTNWATKSGSTGVSVGSGAVTTTAGMQLQLKPWSTLPPAESFALISFESLLRLLGLLEDQLQFNYSAVAEQVRRADTDEVAVLLICTCTVYIII